MGWLDRMRGKPEPEDFARKLLAELRRQGDRRLGVYDGEEFRIVFTEDGDDAGVANLHNVYAEYAGLGPADRRAFVESVARGFLAAEADLPGDLDRASDRLRPIVRSRSYFEFIRLEQQVDLPHLEIGEDLAAALVYDLPDSMRSIGQEDLAAWGTSLYVAMETARHNLEDAPFALARIGDGVSAFATGDNYDASRLLLVDRIRELPVDGRPVAMVPNRDALLVAGEDDEAGLGILLELGEKGLSESRPISGRALVLEGGEWVDWSPPEDHPHREGFRRLALSTAQQDYGQQKAILDGLHDERGIDLFVASLMVVEGEEGALRGAAVWAAGVTTLLPRSDLVFFVEGEDVVATGPWDRVVEVAGRWMSRHEDLYPPRYLVSRFPTAEELTSIDVGRRPPM